MNKTEYSKLKIKPLKIAQIAPLYESLPPKLYGGTERVVHYLTEELVNQGHKVTLFASGDSKTKAKLVAPVNEGLRLKKDCQDPLAYHIVEMQEVINRCSDFDILHFHTDYLHFPFSNQLGVPVITTLHGRLDMKELQSVYRAFPYQKLVSISDNQRLPLPHANFIKTIYHGLPIGTHRQGKGEGGYLAFLGRISPEKGVERAIEIALATNTKLKIAAKIDKADAEYFQNKIKALFNHPLIDFIGEINETQKTEFLGNAKALLFPINWPEPFGLVMIEAMACGTPVIAFSKGSVPEILEDGHTGFITHNTIEAIRAVAKVDSLSRTRIRKAFETRFTAARMASDYVALYNALLDTSPPHTRNIPSPLNQIINLGKLSKQA